MSRAKETRRDGLGGLVGEVEVSNRKYMPLFAGTRKVAVTDVIEPETPAARRARAWLQARLERGRIKRFIEADVELTLELAREIDALPKRNRPKRATRVRKYRLAMQSGRFMRTHQGMSISKTGRVVDGQHRLLARIDAGVISVPVVVDITFGAEDEEFKRVDGGGTRSAADNLHVRDDGEKKYPSLRASVATLLMVKRGIKDHNDTNDVADYADGLNQYVLEESCRCGGLLARITTPTAAAIAVMRILETSENSDRLTEFLKGIPTGAGLRGPKLYLREWLNTGPISKVKDYKTNVQKAAGIVHAWNAVVIGPNKPLPFWQKSKTPFDLELLNDIPAAN